MDIGSSWVMSDVLASILVNQLEAFEIIQQRRKGIWEQYAAGLAHWAKSNDVLVAPPDQINSAHLFYLILRDAEVRDRLLAHLQADQIGAAFHYQALHLSEVGRKFHSMACRLPVTEFVSDGLVRLPLHFDLSDKDVGAVIKSVASFRG